ncbi:glycoside hydrolase family 45 protein [Macroventuria anomochaeta]|uniref:Glycoside hydrolase family 45 protein n=1 Tax=Macroventuria anomochaeta TaxID=301207 RepID=A0ACB6S5T7_9PLEO|nr:glycoside hydrolase family 45 protein [Macroventuria anomochaeta]KAF2629551.1 glycoside hydrolase family 45 protein [Macroventuria anomochaeta]
MTPTSHNLFLILELFVVLAGCISLDYSGEALTTRYWDCCKPSCGWKGKASVNNPVGSCTADEKPISLDAGTGCKGGTAFACSKQQPWAINDTLSYGFAGVYLTQEIVGGATEDAWCCACYQLDFTSEPLRGKSMIVQASNTAYDINTANRFTLAIPGGNTTSVDGCATQYGISQSVFGQDRQGVATKDDCQNLPESLRSACQWRFDWLEDASYPSANFKRVVCPSEITAKTGCVRNDDSTFAEQTSGNATQAKPSLAHMTRATLGVAVSAAGLAALLTI